MDPVTQMTVGAAAAALVCRQEEARHALLLGALAGAAPDLDVLIRSETDPLLALQYHRHFTHSIFIAPLIGLLVAGLFKAVIFWKKWPFRRLALFSILGACTHGMIDACTSYGTMLYWPLSQHRESWDVISIIDPIFTGPLFLLTVVAFAFRRPSFARFALLLCAIYLALGVFQRSQALHVARSLIKERGHSAEVLTVRPSFANIILWRTVYLDGDRYYVDAVRTLPFSDPVIYSGDSVDAFSAERSRTLVSEDSVLSNDIERFRFFSQGYLYQHPDMPEIIGDLRYSMLPNSIQPLWGIRVDPSVSSEHAAFEHFRDPSQRAVGQLWLMILGEVAPDSN